MFKFWNDTLKPRGKYELKRALAVQGFNFGILYVFMPIFKPSFIVNEAVVIALFGFVCGCIGIAVNEKIKIQETNE